MGEEDKIILISEDVDVDSDHISESSNSRHNISTSTITRIYKSQNQNNSVYNGTVLSVSNYRQCDDLIGNASNLENQNQNRPTNTGNCKGKKELNGAQIRFKTLVYEQIPNFAKNVVESWVFHRKFIISSLITVISSTGCLLAFPELLEKISNNTGPSDGYSSCLAASTMSTLLILLISATIKLFKPREQLFKPVVSILSILKIGFSIGLSILTLFYAWEDHKVVCNYQDPFLSLMIMFAIITHIVSKWKRLGFRRIVSLITIATGVFVSVDYSLIDHHRCRGHLYAHMPRDPWSFNVHLVWTIAFVISLWLWTVALFYLESSIPVNKSKIGVKYEEYNAVKMTVLRVNTIANEVPEPDEDLNSNQIHSNFNRKRFGANPYSNVSFLTVLNAVQWFQIGAFIFILCMLWNEFVPGFGKNSTSVDKLPQVLSDGFFLSFVQPSFWILIFCQLILSQSFSYLLVLIRSPMIAISIGSLAFPIIGIWSSVSQIRNTYNFVYSPVFTGELICSAIGLPIIIIGTYYMLKLDVFGQPQRSQINRNPTIVA